MDVELHRIEAMPGDRRYAVTFRRPDGGEQTAVAEVGDGWVQVAESALPPGWTKESALYQGAADAIRALDAARRLAPTGPALRDVTGGWDVMLGNIVLQPDGVPACTAHGGLTAEGDVWLCPECGARAMLS